MLSPKYAARPDTYAMRRIVRGRTTTAVTSVDDSVDDDEGNDVDGNDVDGNDECNKKVDNYRKNMGCRFFLESFFAGS